MSEKVEDLRQVVRHHHLVVGRGGLVVGGQLFQRPPGRFSLLTLQTGTASLHLPVRTPKAEDAALKPRHPKSILYSLQGFPAAGIVVRQG